MKEVIKVLRERRRDVVIYRNHEKKTCDILKDRGLERMFKKASRRYNQFVEEVKNIDKAIKLLKDVE